jgi:hypothetical protein
MPEYCKPTAESAVTLAAPQVKTGIAGATLAAPTAFTPVAAATMPLPCLPADPEGD